MHPFKYRPLSLSLSLSLSSKIYSMASSSLVLKRSLSSLLFRPISFISRSFNTNAMRHFDNNNNSDEDPNVQRSDPSLPRRRDDFFSDVYNPFSSTRSLSQVLNLMDQFIENPFLNASHGIGNGGRVNRGWDAKETDDALLLRVDMPGLGKENVKVSVEQNTLIIKGEDEGDEENIRRYSSRIDLPEKIYKIDQIKAEMKNGVLKVNVPKMKHEERNNVFNVRVQ